MNARSTSPASSATHHGRAPRAGAFTLVEILIVVAIMKALWTTRGPLDWDGAFHTLRGARVIPPRHMIRIFDHVTGALEQHLQRETEAGLRRGMHYPTTWDPFFAGYMTLADIYRYPTRHFRFHQRQLTLSRSG